MRSGSRRNRGQVRDAADILQNTAALLICEENVVEQRDQRGALAAGKHVGRPEVRDDRNIERGSDRLRLAHLPCAGEPPAGIRLRARLMIERLSMAADQVEMQFVTARQFPSQLPHMQSQAAS